MLMVKTDTKKKAAAKPSLKVITYAPPAAFLGIAQTPAPFPKAPVGRFQMKSLKCLTGRGFWVQTQANTSQVNSGRAQGRPTILDHLRRWNGVALENGWDQPYIDSFIAKEVAPPEQDPEVLKKGKGPGDPALHEWLKEINTFMRYIITLEGRGRNAPEHCVRCQDASQSANHQCLTCTGMGLVCQNCIVVSHADALLHRIQCWHGSCFDKISLKELGLRIQLGHPTREMCRHKQPAKADDFVILDLDGIHEVGLDFCGCGMTELDHVAQLIERHLFPSTILQPKTAATFCLLEYFEILQYESKILPFEVFTMISRLTDNTGLLEVKDWYPGLIRMVHKWRHTKLIKWAGRAHITLSNLPLRRRRANAPSFVRLVPIPRSIWPQVGRQTETNYVPRRELLIEKEGCLK
ncbi:hypothetical protein NMY22_g9332 [Coprinellus aureogranulatus]|nr:hypothetical protein NMY22_g9332 [Coprinellus aureogranulatus]